ncbi:MAG TPA: Hsp20/alpha crystallin family protein [Vicinamibacterales bacterium]|nr:Hsp20/alpha crystallin family protein [Vicinamibacterales bacterium]
MKNKELVPFTQTPFRLMRRLSDEMERLFEDFEFRRPFAFLAPQEKMFDWIPAIEVFQKDKKLVVRAELPGLTKDDVKIDVTENMLTLQGERKQVKEEKEEGYLRTERYYGSFYRQIALPEGARTEGVKALFKNGVLEIEVPVEIKKLAGRQVPIEEVEKKELVGV